MEWRIFFPLLRNIDTSSTDVITHLLKHKPKYPPEERTDEYFLLPSIQYGLKLRNTTSPRPLLELKVRSQVYPNGTEHWAKVIANTTGGIREVMLQVLISHLKQVERELASYGSKHAKSCLEEFQNLGTPIICITKKTRHQFSYMGCICEQTDMTISFDSKTPNLYYRSICFEGGNPAPIIASDTFLQYLEAIKSYCKQNGISEQLKPIGYPEFLYNLHTSLNQLSTQ